MSGHLQPIKLDSYKPLRELVCENIRQAIIDGTFSPGERLMEIQLADEMGVSRTPVREAIRKLVSHDQFGKIPQSPELQQRILQAELDTVEENLEVY